MRKHFIFLLAGAAALVEAIPAHAPVVVRKFGVREFFYPRVRPKPVMPVMPKVKRVPDGDALARDPWHRNGRHRGESYPDFHKDSGAEQGHTDDKDESGTAKGTVGDKATEHKSIELHPHVRDDCSGKNDPKCHKTVQ